MQWLRDDWAKTAGRVTVVRLLRKHPRLLPAPYFPSMTPKRPSEVLEPTVAVDYGQFYLIGQHVPHESGEALVQLLETAIKGVGIASSEGNEVVVVLSPHQNNFAMRLRIELWATQPPDDLDDWQEAFVTGLVVGEGGLAYESPTLAYETIPVPPGRYAAWITGRGFVNRGWPGSTTPGDAWRVRLWPASGPIPARRLAPGRVQHQRPPDPPDGVSHRRTGVLPWTAFSEPWVWGWDDLPS
jgi:hypothetical protein